MADRRPPALRVSQLDAHELDQEVLHLTKSQLSNLFKYFQTGFLGQYDPEVTAAIKFLLWKFTLSATSQTVGQQLLGIKYGQVATGSNPGDGWISVRQKNALAIFYIVFPWLRERLGKLLALLRLSSWEQQIERWLRWTDAGLKMASLINFLIFLQKGVYLSVIERLLGVRAQFPQQQTMRQISFDFMTRELLWHGFSELLLFLLPLISLQRMKNTALRWLAPRSPASQQQQHEAPTRADLMACVVCSEWPVHPHTIGCSHVFCHYCIASNLKADPGYTCPACGSRGTTDSGVICPQPVRRVVGPKDS